MFGSGQKREPMAAPGRSRLRSFHRGNGNGNGAGHKVKAHPGRRQDAAARPRAAGRLRQRQRPAADAEEAPEDHRLLYIPLRLKLVFVALVSLSWVGFSLWLAIPWIEQLGQSITVPLAAVLIAGIAIIPGYLNAHLISSLLFDRAPRLRFDLDFPAITLIVACFNEEEVIEETLDYAATQDYPGELHILVADDGSHGQTVGQGELCAEVDRRISREAIRAWRQGEHAQPARCWRSRRR